MNSRDKISTILAIISGIVLVALIGIHIDININHYCAQMDADIASEALLTTVIADNGMHIPDTWVASSGVRVIGTPNLGAFFYKVTGNMNLSIGIACSVMMVILIMLMAIYFRQIGFKWYEAFSAIIILFSLSDVASENQSMLFLWASYYVSYFISLYLMLIIYNLSLRNNSVPVWGWIISLILAFLNGKQGLHGCLYCYFPVLGAEILRRLWLWYKKEKESWMVFAWLTCNAVFSFAISKVLGAYGFGTTRNIRHAGEKFFGQVWPALGEVVYFDNAPAVIAVICVLAVIGYFIAVKDMNRDNRELWGTLAPVIALLIFVLSLTFTTMEVAVRYFIPELFIVATGIGLFMNRIHRPTMKIQPSVFVAMIATMLGIVAGRYYYTELITGDRSSDSAEVHVATWMQENGYDYGYAIFDNANTVTVMSNYSVKVRAVNNMKDMEGCKWLSDSTWYPPTKSSEGKTCYLVSEGAKEDFEEFLERVSPGVVEISEVDRYTVYVLDHDYTVWVD